MWPATRPNEAASVERLLARVNAVVSPRIGGRELVDADFRSQRLPERR
jgi:hypothetical protein